MTTSISRSVLGNFGLAATGLMGLASLTAATPASAQQALAEAQSGSAACAHLDNKTDAGVLCSIREIDKRIDENKRRTLEAERRGAEADRRAECTSSFIAEIKASPQRLDAAKALLGGRSIREVDPCSVLAQLRKG